LTFLVFNYSLKKIAPRTYKGEHKFKIDKLIFNFNMILWSIFGNVLGVMVNKI